MDFPSVEQLESEIAELVGQMSDPAAARDVALMKRLRREHGDKTQLLELLRELAAVQQEHTEAEDLAASDDAEMAALATEDAARLATRKQQLQRQIEELLIPRDPRDDRDVIIEIRAGAGGEEAALFAADLFRAYTRYAEGCGWRVHTVSSSHGEQGGLKEVIAEVTGKEVFGTLKFERGVHRVQRVPETEKQGRIHTSTVTVAVLPQAEEVDVEVTPEDLRIDTYRASGAGGQHVNKTDSAIRITHLPTNTVVAVQDERSQHKNKDKAMKILRSRLLEAQEEKQRSEAAADRKAQVGTGDRSEKIRTYNFPQDRITDHRIKKSWPNIEGVMAGQFGTIFRDVRAADRKVKMSQLR